MEMLHISCNMSTRDLPDMYASSPQALGIHIRQITRAHVTTIKYSTTKYKSYVQLHDLTQYAPDYIITLV